MINLESIKWWLAGPIGAFWFQENHIAEYQDWIKYNLK
jgi:hypothetical protein